MEYDEENRTNKEPAFALWVPDTLRRRDRIISKVKARYWKRAYKFSIRMPKNVDEAYQLDEENGNTL